MMPVLPPPFPTIDPPSMSMADHPIQRVRAMLSGDTRSNSSRFGNLLDRAMTATPNAGLTVPERRVVGFGSGEMTLGGFIAALGGSTHAVGGFSQSSIAAPSGDWAASLPPAGRQWADEIEAAAAEAGVDPRLLAGLVWAESEFQPEAVSSSGAIGLTQLMPATARGLGVDPTDPIANLEGGARFLRAMLDKFGSDELALAAYNAGPNRVANAGGIPNIPSVPIYVDRVLEYAASLGYPAPMPITEMPAISATASPAAATVEPVDTGAPAGEVGDPVVDGAEPVTAAATTSGSVPVRAGSDLPVARPGMAGAMERLAQVIEELQWGPPPRRMSVDIPELGGIRVSVTLLEDGIRLDVPRTGIETERLARDLAGALRQRGFDLSGESEPGSSQQEESRPWSGDAEARAKARPVEKKSGWLL